MGPGPRAQRPMSPDNGTYQISRRPDRLVRRHQWAESLASVTRSPVRASIDALPDRTGQLALIPLVGFQLYIYVCVRARAQDKSGHHLLLFSMSGQILLLIE